MQHALPEKRLEGALMSFEITGSVAMDDAEDTLRVGAGLGALGVRLSIDDFVTGYSRWPTCASCALAEWAADRCRPQALHVAEPADIDVNNTPGRLPAA